jgi:hypothetical protein
MVYESARPVSERPSEMAITVQQILRTMLARNRESTGGDHHDTYEQAAAEVIMTDLLPNRSMTKYAMKEKNK